MEANGHAMMFSEDGLSLSYLEHSYQDSAWIRIAIDEEYTKRSAPVFHLEPFTETKNKVLVYSTEWPEKSLLDTNAVIIRRKDQPFSISTLVRKGTCVIAASDRFVGLASVTNDQIVSNPPLLNKFIEQWQDQRMCSTSIWVVGPCFYEDRFACEESVDLIAEIKATMTELSESRAIRRVHYPIPENAKYVIKGTDPLIKHCSATYYVDH